MTSLSSSSVSGTCSTLSQPSVTSLMMTPWKHRVVITCAHCEDKRNTSDRSCNATLYHAVTLHYCGRGEMCSNTFDCDWEAYFQERKDDGGSVTVLPVIFSSELSSVVKESLKKSCDVTLVMVRFLALLRSSATTRWCIRRNNDRSCDTNRNAELFIEIRYGLCGGGCKNSVEQKSAAGGTSSPLSGSASGGGTGPIGVPGPSTAPRVLRGPPLVASSSAIGKPTTTAFSNNVSYTRRGDDDDEVITIHGVDDSLSEVDVHSVDMHADDDVGRRLPNTLLQHPTNHDRSGAATSDREHKSTRKSLSELSRASSQRSRSMASLGAIVSGVVSEHNEAAAHGHSDAVLRRLVIDHGIELGRGGFGVVYLAHDRITGHRYAVKEAHYGKTGGDALMNNLRSEFRALSHMSHPNVIRVYNFLLDEVDMIARIILELAVGGSVRKMMRNSSGLQSPGGGKAASPPGAAAFGSPVAMQQQQQQPQPQRGLPEAMVRRIMYQALLGLQYLHRHGIIHRDIKPDNLLLGDDNVVKLSDFGTCKSTIHASTGTTTTVVGTVCYMSPESISGSFSSGSDIWGIGATAVELFSGQSPWSELRMTQSVQLVFHIGSAKPPLHRPACQATTPLSRHALQFLEACFMFDPKTRPTALDLLRMPWFDGVEQEMPVLVTQYTAAHPLPAASGWRPPPIPPPQGSVPVSPPLAGGNGRGGPNYHFSTQQQQQQQNQSYPPYHHHHHAFDAADDAVDTEDTFESWPSNEEEQEVLREDEDGDDDGDEEYEYVPRSMA